MPRGFARFRPAAGRFRPPRAPLACVCARFDLPALNHGMPVPFSEAHAPVTPSMAQRPWMISRSAFFSSEKGTIGLSPPPGYVPYSG